MGPSSETLSNEIESCHKITYNAKRACLLSNIFIFDGKKALISKFKNDILSNFPRTPRIKQEYQRYLHKFQVVEQGELIFVNALLTQEGKDLFQIKLKQ